MPSSAQAPSPQALDTSSSVSTSVGGGQLSLASSTTIPATATTTNPVAGAGTATASVSITSTVSPSSARASTVVQNTGGAPPGSTITPDTHAASGGVPTGAAAGIGVGCAVVGALVALMLSYLFFRKHETRHSSRRSGRMQNSKAAVSDKEPAAFFSDKEPAAVISQGQTIDSDLDRLLPQEADDSTIRKKASTLFDQLELHVENYYRDVGVAITPAMESELSRFSSPHLSEPLVAFLNSTSRPRQLIKHSLAFHVISLTSAAGESTRSLLPPGIVEMARAVNKRKPTPDSGLAFSRWRMLTVYLRPDLLPDTRATNTQPDPAIDEAIQSFTRVFAAWSKPDMPDAERINNLRDIMEEVVRFAVWLFSQPSSFKYDWKPAVDVRDRTNRTVVTVPALLKITDNRGQPLVRPLGIVGASRTRV